MKTYRDNYPNNIESAQKLYIQYSHDIIWDYSAGKYPDGTEEDWNWEEVYIPIKHKINGLEVGRHEWMRIKVGELNTWTYPIRISANVTNIDSISSEITIENETYTEFIIVLTFQDGTEINSEPVLIRNGKDGVEIVSSEIRDDGNLYITYSDGRIDNVGRAQGDDANLPPAYNDDYVLSQSGGNLVWIDVNQVLAKGLSATLPIEYNFVTGNISHNNDDGNKHIPIGGTNGEVLSTDGNGNYSWITQLEAKLTEDFNTTVTVGGIDAGTSLITDTPLEQVLKDILAPYVSSTLTSFTVNRTPSLSTYEAGATATLTDGVFTYTLDSDGNPPKDFIITGTGFTGTYQSSPIASDGSVITFTGIETKTWQLNANNANNQAINQRTYNMVSRFYAFYDTGILPSNSTEVRSMSKSFLDASNNGTFTIFIPTGELNISFAIPSGKTPVVLFRESSNADVTTSFTVQTFNVNDAGGNPWSYDIYTSTLAGSGYVSDSHYDITIN